ncbi:MAG: phosphoribosylamine--glycine ligase [Lachnospiraceae bacterium]|nr:phosphoribosylamine--glycine ligase [Lachnospiraceae bacterium]
MLANQKKVLVVGGGGREHAIAWKLSKSSKVGKIYCAPGNAGTAAFCENVAIGVNDFDALTEFACKENIDFVVIGPDDPLAAGIVDAFNAKGIKTFGPDKKAAILEASKAFSKDLMKKYNIPTADYEVFTEASKAIEYLNNYNSFPVVLKADGLALGKGVLICKTREEALEGVNQIMVDKQFGLAGSKLVIEEFMTGREVSVLTFVDGENYLVMSSAQDHKRAKDNDEGLNTGGMGTFSPSPFYTKEIDEFCRKEIFDRTVKAMKAEGRTFKGVIFYGLMLTEKGPKVLEFNARFGDPETQSVLPRMKSDLFEMMEACVDGTLGEKTLEFEDNAAVTVVAASGGYPEAYAKGYEISGLDSANEYNGEHIFHAGTKLSDGKTVTSGGRVLGVTAVANSLVEAREAAYKAIEKVDFKDMFYRHDIGNAFLK